MAGYRWFGQEKSKTQNTQDCLTPDKVFVCKNSTKTFFLLKCMRSQPGNLYEWQIKNSSNHTDRSCFLKINPPIFFRPFG